VEDLVYWVHSLLGVKGMIQSKVLSYMIDSIQKTPRILDC
jgi:hypothetical protein